MNKWYWRSRNSVTYTMASRQKKSSHTHKMNKTYRVCLESGELLSKKRYKAASQATLSIKAKQKRD